MGIPPLTQEINGLILLFMFDRGFYHKQLDPDSSKTVEVLRREVIKCRIWFSNSTELNEFLAKHRQHPAPEGRGMDKETKWVPFMTVTKEELGIK